MTAAFTYQVLPEQHGERLDRVLAQSVKSHDHADVSVLTRQRIQALISQGQVHIFKAQSAWQQILSASHKVQSGQLVQMAIPAAEPSDLLPEKMNLDIVFEDDDLIVLNKAAHQVVHPGAGVRQPTLVHGLLAHCPRLSGIGGVMRPGIVHRLDAGTTGLIVVAKNDAAHVHLSAQFQARTVHKQYLALVCRSPVTRQARDMLPESGAGDRWHSWREAMGRERHDRRRFTCQRASVAPVRSAWTQWRVLGGDAELLLLAFVLHTGRTHQIRVHASEHIGPILGDALYRAGVARRPLLEGAHAAGLTGLDHHALHAAQLAFCHPKTEKRMAFGVPPPTSWRETACFLGPALAWCHPPTPLGSAQCAEPISSLVAL